MIDAWDWWLSKFQHIDSLCFRFPWLWKPRNDWCKGSRSPIGNDPCVCIDNVNNIIHHGLFLLKIWTFASLDGPWCEVYDLFKYFFLFHYVARIFDWYWGRILFIICYHDSLLYLMKNLLYDVLVAITHHVMLWDPLLYVAGILLLSSSMFFFEIPLMPCWRDVHHACFYVLLIGVFWLRVPSCGISLRATPVLGNFFLYDGDIISCVHHIYWQHLM